MNDMIILMAALIALISFTGCTFSLTIVHTEGTASDVVDETSAVTPSTNITVPLK